MRNMLWRNSYSFWMSANVFILFAYRIPVARSLEGEPETQETSQSRSEFLTVFSKNEAGDKTISSFLPLKPIGFLLGKWRSEFGGKAFFPTMPRFTYGEQIEFNLCHDEIAALTAVNYTATAWNNGDLKELHTENGFITANNKTGKFSLNTVMSNGFITVEDGKAVGDAISFVLKKIGRLGFSRDLPVRQILRTWRLIDPDHLEAKLWMSTFTHHKLIQHTFIVYKRVTN